MVILANWESIFRDKVVILVIIPSFGRSRNISREILSPC